MQGAPAHRIEAVVIGASAGGVNALLALLSGLPASFRLPIAAVLHLPEDRDSLLIELFQQRLPMAVQYARPSIDVLMASAADAYGPHLAGILLTGANFDSAAGTG